MSLASDPTVVVVAPPLQAASIPAAAAKDQWYDGSRLKGLSRFASAITVLNILGHSFLGFEQSWITPFAALAAAYTTELIGEYATAREARRRPAFYGSWRNLAMFLLSAHITGLAVGMLLFASEQVWVIAFAASAAVASKYVFRIPAAGDWSASPKTRHFLNPSNFGITLALVLFPTVGIAPPYQFTENISGVVDWLLPLFVIGTGSYLNIKATKRIPVIVAWVLAFALQAAVRSSLNGTPLLAGLMPMSGFAFILFTFYMITDPATSPSGRWQQVVYAVAVAVAYAVFMELHVVFGLFYSLTAVCALRGALAVAGWSLYRPAPGSVRVSQ